MNSPWTLRSAYSKIDVDNVVEDKSLKNPDIGTLSNPNKIYRCTNILQLDLKLLERNIACLHVNIPIPKLSYSKILKTPIFKFLYFFSDLRILKHLNFYIFTSWIVTSLNALIFSRVRIPACPSSRPRIAKSEGIPSESFLLFLSRNELPSGGGGGGGCSVALFDCRFNPRYIP